MEFLRGVCIYKGVIEPKELPEAPCESFGSIDGRSSGPGSLTQKQVLVRIYLAKLSSGWFQPIWKVCETSNWIISPNRGENKKYLKAPPSYDMSPT